MPVAIDDRRRRLGREVGSACTLTSLHGRHRHAGGLKSSVGAGLRVSPRGVPTECTRAYQVGLPGGAFGVRQGACIINSSLLSMVYKDRRLPASVGTAQSNGG